MFVIADKYHVLSTLGSGGMGAVYEAVHGGTGRRVAVKMLRSEISQNPRARQRFVKEARAAGSLSSRNVAEIYDAGTDEVSGLPYLVMELLDGPNLRDALEDRHTLPAGVVMAIAAHVASGLAEAHAAGIVHRDVKPANVVLCRDSDDRLVAKIVDFGVAKSLDDEDGGLTRTGDVVGSLPYMSPEQLLGKSLDATSDLWSLGVVMYEALTGARPTGDEEALGAIVRRVCDADAPRLSSMLPAVPRNVEAVVHRALERDRRKRFSSAKEMEQAIVALLPGGANIPMAALDSGGPTVAITSPQTNPTRTRRVAIAGAALIVASATSAIVGGRRTSAPVEPHASLESPPPPSTVVPPPTASVLATSAIELSPSTTELPEPVTTTTVAGAKKNVRPRPRPNPATTVSGPTRPHDPLDHM